MRLSWVRRDRWYLRQAAACDRAGWQSLTDDEAVREWRLAGDRSAEETTRWVIERDGDMIGGLAVLPVPLDPAEPLHPWEQLDSEPPKPQSEPRSDGRLVTRLFARPRPDVGRDDRDIGWAVGAPLKALLQQAGGRRLVARVPLHWLPEPSPPDASDAPASRGIRWAPSTWLQQFTYRAVDARALSVWTDAGFRLEGFYPSEPPVARLVWDNTRG